MTTTPKRIKLSRAKGWRMPPNTLKVDRSTRWGNPFVIGRDVSDAAGAVKMFRMWLGGSLDREPGLCPDPRVRDEMQENLADLRGKDLATHGVPFYAGWGLTRDLGPIPTRRGRSRSLDELIAAALLLYPRYLDPATGLPCPPEVLFERLAAGVRRRNPALVMLRRTQGGLRRIISGMGFAA